MEVVQENYWKNKVVDKDKKYIISIINMQEVLFDYQPSMIWLDEFDTNIPYINGYYADGFFSGSFTNQSLLTFDLNSLDQLESIFKDGMYIYA
jgi:hypothetical protein